MNYEGAGGGEMGDSDFEVDSNVSSEEESEEEIEVRPWSCATQCFTLLSQSNRVWGIPGMCCSTAHLEMSEAQHNGGGEVLQFGQAS